MFPNEAARMFAQWLPLAQATLTLNLSGIALLVILLALGAYWGYQQGFRNLITIALWTIIGYILTVQGGTIVVDIINRFWQNGPRLVAFAIGQNPSAAPQLDPLIQSGFQIPLFFRFIAFIVAVLLGFFFAPRSGWKGNPNPGEPLAKPLGLFVGALIVLLWTNAAVVFWEQFVAGGGGFGGPVAQFLNTLPNISVLMPSLIAIFFLIIIVLIVFNFPKVWQAGGGPPKK
ncbi:MAG TPA: hypothetical protein PKD53_11655 [Chloroflexaceae bacterium]|nr:hypothetical protein [Chloroflexaceae bacterium]